MNSKIILFPKPNKVEIGEIEIPAPGSRQILTRTIYSAVRAGAERRVFTGKEKEATFPLVPGYENVGVIVEAGENVHYAPGTMVFISHSEYTGRFGKFWGGHMEYALADANQVIPIPDGVDPYDALYTSVAAVSLKGIKRGMISQGDTVAIVGLGLIGHIAVQMAKLMGAKVIAIDKDQYRLGCAKQAGADFIVDSTNGDLKEMMHDFSQNGGIDVTIDANGIGNIFDDPQDLVQSENQKLASFNLSKRVILMGDHNEHFQKDCPPLLLTDESNSVSPWCATFEEKKEVMVLLFHNDINPEIIPAAVYEYKDAKKAYQRLVNSQLLHVVFSWNLTNC